MPNRILSVKVLKTFRTSCVYTVDPRRTWIDIRDRRCLLRMLFSVVLSKNVAEQWIDDLLVGDFLCDVQC